MSSRGQMRLSAADFADRAPQDLEYAAFLLDRGVQLLEQRLLELVPQLVELGLDLAPLVLVLLAAAAGAGLPATPILSGDFLLVVLALELRHLLAQACELREQLIRRRALPG